MSSARDTLTRDRARILIARPGIEEGDLRIVQVSRDPFSIDNPFGLGPRGEGLSLIARLIARQWPPLRAPAGESPIEERDALAMAYVGEGEEGPGRGGGWAIDDDARLIPDPE